MFLLFLMYSLASATHLLRTDPMHPDHRPHRKQIQIAITQSKLNQVWFLFGILSSAGTIKRPVFDVLPRTLMNLAFAKQSITSIFTLNIKETIG